MVVLGKTLWLDVRRLPRSGLVVRGVAGVDVVSTLLPKQ